MRLILFAILFGVYSCQSSTPNHHTTAPKPEQAAPAKCDRLLEELVQAGRDSFHFPEKNPETLEEAFSTLDSSITKELKSWITCLEDGDFSARVHFSIGLSIRNTWGLWGKSTLSVYFNKLGIVHPDDMSGIILDSYQRRLKGEDIKLQEQVSSYIEYWEEQGKDSSMSGPSIKDRTRHDK